MVAFGIAKVVAPTAGVLALGIGAFGVTTAAAAWFVAGHRSRFAVADVRPGSTVAALPATGVAAASATLAAAGLATVVLLFLTRW